MKTIKQGCLIVTFCTLVLAAVVLFIWPGIVRNDSIRRAGEKNSYMDPDRERYVYPITVESPDWFSYSIPEKREMLKIDEQSLKQMSESMLVEAIADYPYLVDIFLVGTMEEGLAAFASSCSAYAELLRRENYQEILVYNAGNLLDYYAKNPRSDGQTEAVCDLLQEMIKYYQTKT